MNSFLSEKVQTQSPGISGLREDIKQLYVRGLELLSQSVSEDFFDLEEIDLTSRFEREGLFYEIPYFSSDILYQTERKADLLMVYRLDRKSSFCPLRITCEPVDGDWALVAYHQRETTKGSKEVLGELGEGVTLSQLVT